MKFKFFFKVSTLLLALVMTVYCMYLLNQGHLSDFLGSLGMGRYSQTLEWCSNRVSKIEGLGAEPWTVEEKDHKWLITKNGGEPKILDYLEMEKWLANYCQLKIKVYRGEGLLDKDLRPFAKAFFNDGKSAQISILDKDTYQINEMAFQSAEMAAAVADLKKLLALPNDHR